MVKPATENNGGKCMSFQNRKDSFDQSMTFDRKYGSFIRRTTFFSLCVLASYRLSIQSAPELCPRIQNQFMENNGTNFPTEFTKYRFYYNHTIYKPVYKFECLYPIGRIAAGSKLILNNNATQIGLKPRGRSLEQTGENEFLTQQSMNLQIDVNYPDYMLYVVETYHFVKLLIIDDRENAKNNNKNQPELGEVPYGGFEIWSQNEVEEPAEKPSLAHSLTWFIVLTVLFAALGVIYFYALIYVSLGAAFIVVIPLYGCDRVCMVFMRFIRGGSEVRQHPTNQVMRPSDRSRDLPGVSDLPPGYENIGEYPKVESSPPPYKAPTDFTV